jgi:hypothetical protein
MLPRRLILLTVLVLSMVALTYNALSITQGRSGLIHLGNQMPTG